MMAGQFSAQVISPLPLAHNLLRVLVKATAKRSIPGSEVLSHATLPELEPILDFLVQHSVAARWLVGIPEPVRIFWMVHVLSYFWQRCRPAHWLVLPIFYLLLLHKLRIALPGARSHFAHFHFNFKTFGTERLKKS